MDELLLTGTHVVQAVCPRCGQVETIAVGLSSVLTVPTDDRPSLRVKLKGKPIDHDCRQLRLPEGVTVGGTTGVLNASPTLPTPE